ncbi:chymotrypsin-2-like [Ctenocephalides felis]|uniref:chymotrypsin-2-like n=1 Tax=Ctenocephalides felis TaxID=7515 RepID=UPI000E6E1456|nr:chymotrypsin-2-like [Ctenocephalides felis]
MLRFVVLSAIVAISLAAPNNRIVNGNDAKEGQYPYVVSLRGPTGGHTCGASIIDRLWILTAAHCVYGREDLDFSVQYGVTTISQKGDTVVDVDEIIVHKGYNPSNSYINDIALLKLSEPLKYSKFAQPVTLPEANEQTKHNAPATLVGWGINSTTDGVLQTHLQELHYQIVGSKECGDLHFRPIYKEQICAAYPDYDRAQCSGDSGGPLTVDEVQVGIVSWSVKPCAVARFPGVFTQVSFYRDWIKEHTGV